MEMLTKNIVMSGRSCGENGEWSEDVMPAVSEELNMRMIEAVGLARAFVPVQPYTRPMEAENSLACGTVFGDLVMPYVKGSALERSREEECMNEQR